MTQKLVNAADIQDSSITNAKIVNLQGSKFSNLSGGNFDGIPRFKLVTQNCSNLLINGGFESLTGWVDLGTPISMTQDVTVTCGLPWDNSVAFNAASLKFNGISGTTQYRLRQDANLNAFGFPGPNGDPTMVNRCRATLWGVSRSGNEPAGFALGPAVKVSLFEDNVETQISEFLQSPGNGFTWLPFQFSFLPAVSTNLMRVRVDVGATQGPGNPNGSVYFDNFVLTCGQISSYDGV